MPSDDPLEEPNYAVGYKRPPASGQFKKGQSGNPTGRPKRDQMQLNSFEKFLSRRVEVVVNGNKKRMSFKEVLELEVVEKAPALPPREIIKLLSELEVAVARNRALELEMQSRRASSVVRHYADCADIVRALTALGMAHFENGRIKVNPDAFYAYAGERVDGDERELTYLRDFYFPGTESILADPKYLERRAPSTLPNPAPKGSRTRRPRVSEARRGRAPRPAHLGPSGSRKLRPS